MAKRNKKIARAMRAGVSPYARYGKVPYHYSPELRTWERTVGARVRADQEHEDAVTRAHNERRIRA
jgi:hypothetical protein